VAFHPKRPLARLLSREVFVVPLDHAFKAILDVTRLGQTMVLAIVAVPLPVPGLSLKSKRQIEKQPAIVGRVPVDGQVSTSILTTDIFLLIN